MCVGTLIGAASGRQQKLSRYCCMWCTLRIYEAHLLTVIHFLKLILLEKVLHSRKINSKSPGSRLNFTIHCLIANTLRNVPVPNNCCHNDAMEYTWFLKCWSFQNGILQQKWHSFVLIRNFQSNAKFSEFALNSFITWSVS